MRLFAVMIRALTKKEIVNVILKGNGLKELVSSVEGRISRKMVDDVNKELSKYKIDSPFIQPKDLYFIRCLETNRIKIGISDNVSTRFYHLNSCSPTKLKIEAVIEYGVDEFEKHLHKKYSNFHYKNEWFNSNKDLEDFIDYIKDYGNRETKKSH